MVFYKGSQIKIAPCKLSELSGSSGLWESWE